MTYLTSGIILAKEDWRDYDRKITVYTLGQGKITAIVKGAKKITSKLNSHLEFFSVNKLMIAKGRVVNRVAAAQIGESYKNIKSNIEKTVVALYFLETVNLLVKYDYKDDIVFEITESFLSSLDSGITRQDDLLLLNKYLFELLSHLGYQPEIKSTKQKGLIAQFNKLIMVISDREVKSYSMLSKLFI